MEQARDQLIKKANELIKELGGKDKVTALAASGLAGCVSTWLLWKLLSGTPKLRVPLEPLESQDFPAAERPLEVDPTMNLTAKPGFVQCYDKSTAERIGEVPDMTAEQVEECIQKARRAQVSWAKTSFATRRYFLKLLLKYSVDEKDVICRTMIRDTGKSKLDAVCEYILRIKEFILIETNRKLFSNKTGIG